MPITLTPTTHPMHPTQTAAEANKLTIERINAAFAANDTDTFLAASTEDVIWAMAGEAPYVGKPAVAAFLASMASSAPAIMSVDHTFATAEFGTATGQFKLPVDGPDAPTYSFADVYQFKDGKVCQLTNYIIEHKPTQTLEGKS